MASPRARPRSEVPSTCTSNEVKRRRCVSWRYRSSESHRRRRVGMSSASRRTSISPTSLTESRSAMRLNIPSAAFANSSSSEDPYARIPTSAVCSISSYRTTGKTHAKMKVLRYRGTSRALEVRVGLVRDHPGSRALDVHHIPHPARRPFLGDERVEGREVDLPVRFDRVDEGLRQAFDRSGDRLALEQRFATGPTQVPNPSRIGLKV